MAILSSRFRSQSPAVVVVYVVACISTFLSCANLAIILVTSQLISQTCRVIVSMYVCVYVCDAMPVWQCNSSADGLATLWYAGGVVALWRQQNRQLTAQLLWVIK